MLSMATPNDTVLKDGNYEWTLWRKLLLITFNLHLLLIKFSGCTVLPDSKYTVLGTSDQEASPSAGKNTSVVLVPCSHKEVHPYNFFQWFGYF